MILFVCLLTCLLTETSERDSVDLQQKCLTGIILQLAMGEGNWPLKVRDSQLNTDWNYSTA